ncbi:class I SAM-dependent methyltransferase [Desulfovibrio ferrophilus]|uniref:Methyltransferase type 11 domain-containing protein n=1 Tax=Desulfovibrio ferrophilus TaxID=241368 RepID=A0A2Z6B1H3_9BACT|nr:class I SAM-dependent methyltransferase [Desulfovibrio ferrophilus]BBD09313.1 uncharacterized protein DFE_2587 [Desulfovibrio ferrophilus]
MADAFEQKATYDKRTAVYHKGNHDNPKHIFKMLGEMIAQRQAEDSSFALIDIGGANGEFVHYLLTRFNGLEAFCLDYSEDLLNIGRSKVPQAHFVCGDARQLSMFEDGRFNYATMLGVISIFDDFTEPLDELIRVTAKGGAAYIFSSFNDYPIDTLLRWRYSGDNGEYNLGWNHFSKASISAHLDADPRVSSHTYVDFELPFDLPYRADDPIRSWTETTAEGNRILKNGLKNLELQILCINT